MYCWGDGSGEQLGVSLGENEHLVLTPLNGNFSFGEIRQIACGEEHTLILTANGKVFSCGRNSNGRLGRQANRKTRLPAQVGVVDGAVGVACGRKHCLAFCESGQVYSWGWGKEGQLGIGPCKTDNRKPRKVQIPSPIPIQIYQVACGNDHSLALTAGGEVFSWGQNSHGQLGLGKEVSIQDTPAPILSLTGVPVTQISAGGAHSLFLSLSGLVYCCGANAVGQLGLNCIDERGRFNVCEVPALRSLGVSYISCGEAHTAVLAQEGGVFTFGEGTLGQLGHNSTANELRPRRVENIEGPASQIACGSHHTLVLTSSGGLLAFGSGVKGQLGQGSTENSLQPTPVPDTWRTAAISAHNMKISCGWNSNFIYVVPPESFKAKDQSIIDKENLQKLLSLRNSKKNAQREIVSIFSSSSRLVASFIQSSQTPEVNSTAVNMTAVRETFRKLKEIPRITNQIPMVPLVQKLVEASKVMKSVDIFLILPECHLFQEDQNIVSLVLPLARAILQLSDASTQLLRRQWSSLGPCSVKKHVHMWKHALSSLLWFGLDPTTKRNIKAVLQFLKHLHEANERADEKIPVEEFHINLHELLWQHFMQMLDKEIPATFCQFPFVLNLKSKVSVFNTIASITQQCAQSHPPMPVLNLHVKRTALIQDTFQQLSITNEVDFRKALVVKFDDDFKDNFVNRRDLYLNLFDELLSPDSGMFMYNDSGTLAWFPSRPGQPLDRYFLFGVLCGLAMYNNNIVRLPFPLALFKKLLGVKPSLEDVKEFSPVEGRCMQYLLDYPDDDVENMDMTFCVNWNGREVELDPSEKGKAVTDANREEFVRLYVDYIMNKSVEGVFEEFRRGFYKVCDEGVVKIFQPEELKGVMVGAEDYDWDTLKWNTIYVPGYHPQHPNIVMFWEVFEDLTPEQKIGFLLFVTGYDRIPVLGMGQIRMTVEVLLSSTPQHFPEALTCHNLLRLPVYMTKEGLKAKLTEAIAHNRGFWKD